MVLALARLGVAQLGSPTEEEEVDGSPAALDQFLASFSFPGDGGRAIA